MRKALPAIYGSLRLKSGGLAGLLAQAPAVSAAFGRWPGFILMLTAMLVLFALGVGVFSLLTLAPGCRALELTASTPTYSTAPG
jgi:hypothetical protein